MTAGGSHGQCPSNGSDGLIEIEISFEIRDHRQTDATVFWREVNIVLAGSTTYTHSFRAILGGLYCNKSIRGGACSEMRNTKPKQKIIFISTCSCRAWLKPKQISSDDAPMPRRLRRMSAYSVYYALGRTLHRM
jgi:hypothetical protein